MGEGDSAGELRVRAGHLAKVGRHIEAIPLLARALSLQPDDPDLRCDLAIALMHAGDLLEADRIAHDAIAQAPEYERPYRVRSIVLRQVGRPRDALTVAREAVRLEPTNIWALHALAQAYLATGNAGAAWGIAREVIRLDPESASSHQLAGQVAIALRWWPVAEKASREALRLDPADWAAMNNLGVALLRRGKRAEAAQAYDRAAHMNPAADTPRRNIVRVAHPTQSPAWVLELLVLVAMPVTAPIILIKWLARWSRVDKARPGLSEGGRLYAESMSFRRAPAPLTPVEFGIVCGLGSLILWALLSPLLIGALVSAWPRSQFLDVLLPLVAMVPLAVVTGLVAGRVRARRSARTESR